MEQQYSPAQNILDTIKETKFNRSITFNYRGIEKSLADGASLYTAQELDALKQSEVSELRLPPRITEYYHNLAKNSRAITNLIKARPEETNDLSGERDPSNQLRYSPVPGLLHKYELVLLYVVRACSSWCRYCYRSDFLTNKTEKEIASIEQICGYIADYNAKAAAQPANTPIDEQIVPIKEALLSGGDPMVLNNKNLFEYMYGLAKAGVRTIRIGTKELAFFPERFDANFFAMLDVFHEHFPDVNLAFMVHFTHPDELLEKDIATGAYVIKENGMYKRIPVTDNAIKNLRSRAYVTMENQTPIIDSVNDDADALRLLQIELKRAGINNHYYFQCREIEGHKIFAVPVEKAWKIHQDSQKGLSGIEKSRFAMSTEAGKLEVVSVIDKLDLANAPVMLPEVVRSTLESILGEGLVVMKIHRSPYKGKHGDLVIARRNPEALWISGYEDRIIYDARLGNGNQYNPLMQLLGGLFGQADVLAALQTLTADSEKAA